MRRSEEAGNREHVLFAPGFGGGVIALHCAVGGGRSRYQWRLDCRCLSFQRLGKKALLIDGMSPQRNNRHEATRAKDHQ